MIFFCIYWLISNRTIEQNYIAHVMAYSACIGPYNTDDCRQNRGEAHVRPLHNFASRPVDSFSIHVLISFSFIYLGLFNSLRV
jgi:hypothetical protein